MTRETTIRLDSDEREKLGEVRQTMFGEDSSVPLGYVVRRLCENFQKREQYL